MAESGGRLEQLEARLAALAAGVRAELPERARALRTQLSALARGDADAREQIRRLAHMVRGTAGSHGMDALTAPAAAVEAAARDASDAELTSVGGALADALDVEAQKAPPRAVAPAPAPASAGLVKPLAGRSVLAIDDDAATRKLLTMTLSNLGGASVTIEERAAAFFDALAERAYDVVIVDAMMPELNGLACLERIAASPMARDGTRYFVLSAAEQTELGWTLPASLRTAWLRKPFRPRDLLDAIGRALAT